MRTMLLASMLTPLMDNPLFESWLERFGLAAIRPLRHHILRLSPLEEWAFVFQAQLGVW